MSTILNPPKVRKVRWKLKETMARRKISNKALADELKVHLTTISRLRTQDILPEIGGETLCELINAINTLSVSDFEPCTLLDLMELVPEN